MPASGHENCDHEPIPLPSEGEGPAQMRALLFAALDQHVPISVERKALVIEVLAPEVWNMMAKNASQAIASVAHNLLLDMTFCDLTAEDIGRMCFSLAKGLGEDTMPSYVGPTDA